MIPNAQFKIGDIVMAERNGCSCIFCKEGFNLRITKILRYINDSYEYQFEIVGKEKQYGHGTNMEFNLILIKSKSLTWKEIIEHEKN